MGRQALHQPLTLLCEKINSLTDSGKDISIVTRLDTDGIASGSILMTALSRLGSRCSLRTISTLTSDIVQELKSEAHDFCIFLSLGSAKVETLQRYLGEGWTIIDHEELVNEHLDRNCDNQIINAWKFGFNGTQEICTGSISYILATMLDKRNTDLSAMAVIASLGDRQDVGEKKTLVGTNNEILKTAESLNLINSEADLLLYNSETIPLHESIARTTFPYIHGLTWNVNNAYSLIKNAGLKMKDNGKWRILSDFNAEEKNLIRDSIAKFIITSSTSSSVEVADHLLGFSYKLTREDNFGHLREARDFANLLEACGRIGKAGLGVALCMGDRNLTLTEAEQTAESYFATLSKSIFTVFSEKWRFYDDGVGSVFINGEGLITEGLLGSVSSLLASSPSLYGRLLFVRALSQGDGGNSYCFSARKCVGNKSQLNMGMLMRQCSEPVGGSGGGDDSRAGCIIPLSKLEIFLSSIRGAISNKREPKFAEGRT
jgi:single-stranded-DNA-specific exonuclease